MRELSNLFAPIKIGPLELRNRIIMPAITTLYDFTGSVRQADFLAERARGGVGLIVVGALQALYPGRRSDIGKVNLHSDEDIPSLREWTKAIQDGGAKAFAQVAVYGYWARNGNASTAEDVGPSEVSIPTAGLHPSLVKADFLPHVRPLSLEDILMIEEMVGDAAVRAQKAGFDGIELQSAAGNLFCCFINPFTNRRTDRYGGSPENRTRLLTESIANIRRKVGEDFPLMCRIPGSDMVPWGLELEDWKKIAPLIEKAGAHALSIYPGWHESRVPRQQMSVPRGAFVGLAHGIKGVVNIPVATNVRINDPLLAAEIVEAGRADLVAMAAPLVADPDLPNKVQDGRLEDIRMCTACCNCWDDLARDEPVSCSINARAGKEAERTILLAKDPKRVLIIGGGPSGMEAARVAALRGHQVTLFEKRDKLGGQLLLAVVPPHKDELKNLIRYLSTQLLKLNVDVRLNQACTVETALSAPADAIIIATGAEPVIPEIPGAKGNHVVTLVDVLTDARPIGQNVVIIGGGLTGCEVGEYLHQQHKRVTILETLPSIGADIGPKNRWVVIDRLAGIGIRMETCARATEIVDNGVKVLRHGKHREFFEADTVVLAVGTRASVDIASGLEGKVDLLYRIGDCAGPGTVRKAIHDGFHVAARL